MLVNCVAYQAGQKLAHISKERLRAGINFSRRPDDVASAERAPMPSSGVCVHKGGQQRVPGLFISIMLLAFGTALAAEA